TTMGGRGTCETAYYRCEKHVCDKPQSAVVRSARKLERTVIEAIVKAASDPVSIEAAFRAYERRRRVRKPVGDAKALLREIEELNAREQTAARAQVDALMKGRSTEVYDRPPSEI